MPWDTRVDSKYCGTCNHWKGKRKKLQKGGMNMVSFPSSGDRAACTESKQERQAAQGPCAYWKKWY